MSLRAADMVINPCPDRQAETAERSRMCGDSALFSEGNLPGGEYGNLSRLKIELHIARAVINRIEAVKNLPED